MFILIGKTAGDELIHSENVPLAAGSYNEMALKLEAVKNERDNWLKYNIVPDYAESAIYIEFEIVKTKLQ